MIGARFFRKVRHKLSALLPRQMIFATGPNMLNTLAIDNAHIFIYQDLDPSCALPFAVTEEVFLRDASLQISESAELSAF